MDIKLDKKLCKKYPKIFAQRHRDMKETAMCWGFECSNGWYWLINMLCSRLQWDIDHNNYPQIEATQVKEKFGTLRFYTNGANDTQEGMISLAEFMSGYICEKCGTTEGVTQTSGWVITLCKKHLKEYKEKRGNK
uniref:Uncharacterized protein n=1 Tax=viral metagenome TaxID=1070528 RepID=A0A6M3Y1S3_9ZZZZ